MRKFGKFQNNESSFNVYNFKLPTLASTFSLWFAGGKLIDVERFDSTHRTFEVKRDSALWKRLEACHGYLKSLPNNLNKK